LTDHLGNVNTVVTGRLLPLLGPGVQYQAEVVSATGYESFGFALPNRSFQSSNYGFGFGGQLKDNEVYGSEGTSYTAKFWQYDPRVAHRWNLDPVTTPGLSPYVPFVDNPIYYNDPNGDCPWCFISAAVDYGIQVADNYSKGSSGYNAWVGDVNFVSVAVSAIPGGGLLGTVAKEALSSTVSWRPNAGLGVEKDITKIAVSTATNVAIDRFAKSASTKIKVSTSNQAVKAAEKSTAIANQAAGKAERSLVKSPNSPKAQVKAEATSVGAQAARNKEVRTKMANAVVGDVSKDAMEKVIEVGTKRTVVPTPEF
ncbi:MAG: hypothetical protein JST36_10370, partial [Bacteroidetes bacterium]|nr:hypothetical protein [Bacteroidota bacterium]